MVKICPECKTSNPDNSDFCKNCGTELKSIASSGLINQFKGWWNEQNSRTKAVTGIGACCIGLLLIIAIVGLLSPDQNLTQLNLDNVEYDSAGEYHVVVGANATEYDIKGSTETNATVTITSDYLNKTNETIPLDQNNNFSYKVSLPANVSEVKIRFDATKSGKNASYVQLTIKREEPKNETSTASNELNSDSVKTIIGGGSEIKSIEVNGGAVTIYYELGTIWDEDDAVQKTSIRALEYMEKLFKDNRVNSVTVASVGTFTDQYGKSSEGESVRITINKDTANKIDWDGIEERVYIEDGHLLKISDSYKINPSIWSQLTFYVPISKE